MFASQAESLRRWLSLWGKVVGESKGEEASDVQREFCKTCNSEEFTFLNVLQGAIRIHHLDKAFFRVNPDLDYAALQVVFSFSLDIARGIARREYFERNVRGESRGSRRLLVALS